MILAPSSSIFRFGKCFWNCVVRHHKRIVSRFEIPIITGVDKSSNFELQSIVIGVFKFLFLVILQIEIEMWNKPFVNMM